MPTPELVTRMKKAADEAWLNAIEECERDKRSVYPRDIINEHCIPAALKAHSEWLAERIPAIGEAIRLALEIDDNAPKCLDDLCASGPCACCEVAAKAAISAALKDSEKGE